MMLPTRMSLGIYRQRYPKGPRSRLSHPSLGHSLALALVVGVTTISIRLQNVAEA